MQSVNLYRIHVQMSAEFVKMNYKNTELQKNKADVSLLLWIKEAYKINIIYLYITTSVQI